MTNKQYEEKRKEVDDMKLFSMSEWREAEKEIRHQMEMRAITVCIVCFVGGGIIGGVCGLYIASLH